MKSALTATRLLYLIGANFLLTESKTKAGNLRLLSHFGI